MRVLFIGGYKSPGGPNEVNRNLLTHLPKSVKRLKSKAQKIQTIESILPILACDVVVFSGLMFNAVQLGIAKALNKKIIYIMHGCHKMETGQTSALEESILTKSDQILCVSNIYADLINEIYPQFSDKISVLYNGVNWKEYDEVRNLMPAQRRDPNRIILFGGGRKEKRNLSVCQAVSELNNENKLNLHIDIYGYFRDTDDSQRIKDIPCVTFHHVIPHSQVNEELYKSRLFIQNSDLESFSLALTDAIGLGCDVLFSRHVGASEIIPGKTEQDIIYDTGDITEIKNKILNVLEHPNNQRLLNSIDKKATSLETAAKNLMAYCRRVYRK